MAKPIKSQWAFGDSSYRVQPPGGKMNVGWLSGEKPPFQYFNWLHYNYNLWEDYFEAKAETISPTMLQSSGTATWNGSVLALSAILNISFRVTTGEQINQLPLGNYTFNDGEVLVFRKDKTNPSPVSLASGTYASLGNGQYAIIAESSLTANAHEFEVVLFRRRGTNLECPINGTIWATGETITFGRSSGIPSVITDHGALSGLGDDDHPQYAQIAGSETISGLWNYTTLPTASANPTTSTQLARKAYVDATVITDHGALSGLGDDDHPQYGAIAQNESVSGLWDFTNGVEGDYFESTTSTTVTDDVAEIGRFYRSNCVSVVAKMANDDPAFGLVGRHNIDNSLTINGTGDYTATFGNSILNSSPCFVSVSGTTATNQDDVAVIVSQTTTTIRFGVSNAQSGAGSPIDRQLSILCFQGPL